MQMIRPPGRIFLLEEMKEKAVNCRIPATVYAQVDGCVGAGDQQWGHRNVSDVWMPAGSLC